MCTVLLPPGCYPIAMNKYIKYKINICSFLPTRQVQIVQRQYRQNLSWWTSKENMCIKLASKEWSLIWASLIWRQPISSAVCHYPAETTLGPRSILYWRCITFCLGYQWHRILVHLQWGKTFIMCLELCSTAAVWWLCCRTKHIATFPTVQSSEVLLAFHFCAKFGLARKLC